MAFRIALLVVGVTIAVLVLAWLITGNRRYLKWSVRVLLVGMGVGLVFFGALFFERLLGGPPT